MSVFVVWIDREHARIFEISSEKMERKTIKAHHGDHHTHRLDSIDQKNQEWHFFQEVANFLGKADRLLILGPGVAKYHFRSYLGEHTPVLAKKLVGCETVDHPTDNQIAAYAKNFFDLSVEQMTSVNAAAASEGKS